MENKVCFITGSASNNGRMMAIRMAQLGYDIAIHHSGRNAENAESIRKEIEAMGRRAEVFVQDLREEHAADKLFAEFREKFDRLDIFVNNAGVTSGGNIPVMTEETFDLIVNVDYRAAVFCIREACEFMKEKGIRGSVVAISSNHHARIWRHSSIYGSTKEAICRFVKYAAVEYIRDGIRVNCIAPGWIEWEAAGPHDPAVVDHVCRNEIPAHRFVTSSDIANWVEFISGPAGLSLTGQTIDLDGGVSLLSGSMEEYGLNI